MKVRKLKQDEDLQIGDIIQHKTTCFGSYTFEVFRITKKYAMVKHNETAVEKYPNKFNFMFSVLPKPKWDATEYNVYRKVDN